MILLVNDYFKEVFKMKQKTINERIRSKLDEIRMESRIFGPERSPLIPYVLVAASGLGGTIGIGWSSWKSHRNNQDSYEMVLQNIDSNADHIITTQEWKPVYDANSLLLDELNPLPLTTGHYKKFLDTLGE